MDSHEIADTPGGLIIHEMGKYGGLIEPKVAEANRDGTPE